MLKDFKRLRNQLNSELRHAKVAYYQQLFEDTARQRPDATWKAINRVLGRQRTTDVPKMIRANNAEIKGPELAEYFNNYLLGSISARQTFPSQTSTGLRCLPESIFLAPTDEREVFQTFMALRNSRALDTDNVQVKPVKYVIDFIVPVLVHIFNLAIESGVFPDAMKIARVSLIFKGGERNLPSNYRPISVLPVFSKGLEKLLSSRITTFFDKNSIITTSQFGFMAGRSTETALLALKEHIVQNIEQNMFTIGIFIDFSKAFDCLDHKILIEKLQCYGIRGNALELLQSYLQGRTQSVHINNVKSPYLPISCGVPQGSILGPLLFNAYINDIVLIDLAVKFIIYADDSTILVSGKDVNVAILKCNEVLTQLSTWCYRNKLKVNPSKTKAIIFRSRNKTVPHHDTITFEQQIVEIVPEHKILGVYFSYNLNWNAHVDYLCKKLSSVTGVLSRCHSLLPQTIQLQIYYALFMSHVNYCCLVWATTTKTNINRLLAKQKKILRTIGNLDRMCSTKEVFSAFNVIRLDHTYDYRLLHTMYFSPPAVTTFIKKLASLHCREVSVHTRNRDMWFVPYFHNNYKLQSLAHNVPSILNKYNHTIGYSKRELTALFCKI